jgi:predicted nuclease with TOPRIM domain
MIIRQKSQEDRLEEMFKARPGEWISLSEIMDMRISQYGRAIHSLRHKRLMNIENKTENQKETGVTHSWFRYVKKEFQNTLFC